MFNFAINYLVIFFAVSYILFIIYMTVIYPDHYNISNKSKKVIDSMVIDYTSLIFILSVLSVVNLFYTKYNHIIFFIINLFILLSCGTALSGFLSKFIVTLLQFKKSYSSYLLYIVIFLIFFILYILFVLKGLSSNLIIIYRFL